MSHSYISKAIILSILLITVASCSAMKYTPQESARIVYQYMKEGKIEEAKTLVDKCMKRYSEEEKVSHALELKRLMESDFGNE